MNYYEYDFRSSMESSTTSNLFTKTPKIDMGTINRLQNDHINFEGMNSKHEKIILHSRNSVRAKGMPVGLQYP